MGLRYGEMEENMSYEPIKRKIRFWIDYMENQPKSEDYADNELFLKEYDEFRSKNDLDCILTDGNLYADTILSLWLPLKFTLFRLNSRDELNRFEKVEKSVAFLKAISDDDTLKKLLPPDNPAVKKLIRLFEIGQTRANVMILPLRELNSKRGKEPYWDYVPYFLRECFEGGDFAYAFGGGNELREWIRRENLEMFFDGEISAENLKDLSGNGDLEKGIPVDLNATLEKYIDILEKRRDLSA